MRTLLSRPALEAPHPPSPRLRLGSRLQFGATSGVAPGVERSMADNSAGCLGPYLLPSGLDPSVPKAGTSSRGAQAARGKHRPLEAPGLLRASCLRALRPCLERGQLVSRTY